MCQIQAAAYGKINLTLDIVGKRSDGYHELKSVMQSIDWHDLLTIRQGTPGEITLQVEGDPFVPASPENIVWRAAELFFRTTGTTGGVHIHLQKNIPSAAGLGGGSADAAATLVALNSLFAADLPLAVLTEAAATLGADVPFCLTGGTQLAEGIGERLTSLPAMPQLPILLIKPAQGIATPRVYSELRPEAWGTEYSQVFMQSLRCGQIRQALAVCGNALETVTLPLVPEAAAWRQRLAATPSLVSMMSGSGPTIFAVFADQESLAEAVQNIPTEFAFHCGQLHHVGVEILAVETGGC